MLYDILTHDSEASIAELSADWEANGGPVDEADFNYWPEELMVLSHGLRTWIEKKVT